MEGNYAEVVGWVRKILDPQCSAEERAICHQVSCGVDVCLDTCLSCLCVYFLRDCDIAAPCCYYVFPQRVEDLKERRNDCLPCGFHLACSVDPVVRHFGLQLLEHFVKLVTCSHNYLFIAPAFGAQ